MPVMPDEAYSDDFMEQFLASQAGIFGYVRSMVPNGADAEEIFQQVALTLWVKRGAYESARGSFHGWAIGIARNHIRNFSRHKAIDNRTQMFSTEVVDRIAEFRHEYDTRWNERQEALASCLAKLPDEQRRWIEDYYGGRCKPKQIADAGGISLRTFYRKVQGLRRALLDCIIKTMGSEADTHVTP